MLWSIEKVGDILCSHFVNIRVLPLRVLVFVHEQGSHTLIKLRVLHVALTDAVLHLEDIFDVHVGSTLDLLEDDGEGERAHIGHHFSSFCTEL